MDCIPYRGVRLILQKGVAWIWYLTAFYGKSIAMESVDYLFIFITFGSTDLKW